MRASLPGSLLTAKPLLRNRVYCLQVLGAMGCALLPVLLQGQFQFIDRGLSYYLLWTVLLTALWVRWQLAVGWCLPAILPGFFYVGYVVSERDEIGYNEVSSILNTTVGEVLGFVSIPRIALTLAVVLAAFAILSWALCSQWLRCRSATPIRVKAVILYWLMAGCAMGYFATGSSWNKQQMYPVNVVSEGYRFISEVQYAKYMHSRLNYTYAGPDASRCPPALTAVMVIGESARAASWSLYGYGRPTNPEVAASLGRSGGCGVVFRDALSAGRLTMNSVPSMLATTPAADFQNYCAQPSVIGVFRAAGYRTAVLSSQVRASEFWDGSVNLMLNDAASIEKLARDEQLPGALRRWLGHDAQARQLAVVHLFGSHYVYSERYPASFNWFHGGNELVDSYDNSIAFTDHVLAGLMAQLAALPTPGLLFYTSDHGENLNDFGDGNIQHACREFTRYEIEVPLLFYANRAFAAAYPQRLRAMQACATRPVSHDNISQTLLGLAGLADPAVYQPLRDLSSERFVAQPRFLIRNLRESVAEAELRATPHCRRVAAAGR